MPDNFGFTEGVKAVTQSMEGSREAAKGLTKQIEQVQGEGLAIAQQRSRERLEKKRSDELRKQLAIVKALDEYRRRKLISDTEYQLKVEFLKKNGSKEWEVVLRIKGEMEKEAQKNAELFKIDKSYGDLVNLVAWILMALLSWWLVWGQK